MALVVTVQPRTGASPSLGQAFIRRLDLDTPALRLVGARDQHGFEGAIFPEIDTIPELGHAATGLRDASISFWDEIRKHTHTPKSNRNIPTGHMYLRINDATGMLRSKIINKKHRPTVVDMNNFVAVGAYPVNVAKIPQPQHRRSANIGTRNILDILKVRVDGH